MEAARLGVVDGLPDATRAEVGVFEEVLRGLEGAAGQVLLLGEGDDLALRAPGEPGAVGALDLLGESGGHEGDGAGDVRVVQEVFAVDEAEDASEAGSEAGDVHVAVGAGPHPRPNADRGGGATTPNARV